MEKSGCNKIQQNDLYFWNIVFVNFHNGYGIMNIFYLTIFKQFIQEEYLTSIIQRPIRSLRSNLCFLFWLQSVVEEQHKQKKEICIYILY